MSNDGDRNKSGHEKGWLYSDIYARAEAAKNQLPRTSILQFGSFTDILSSAGKLIGQNLIFALFFPILFIFLLWSPSEWGGDQVFLAVLEIVKLAGYTISVFLAVKIFDGKDIVDMGLKINRRAFLDFLAGLGIVFLVFFVEFLLFSRLGWITIDGFAWHTMSTTNIFWNLLATLSIFSFTGWSEELLSRGYHLPVISKGLNRPWGVILSSIIFSYMHHDNPGIRLDGLFFILLVGLMLSFAFLRTGQLWLAIGLHTGWNFFASVIFWGGSLSGLQIFSLMDIRMTNFLLQGITVEILALVAITLLVHFYTFRKQAERLDW